MEVKPAEFARMAGVSRQSVYSKIKNHTLVVNAAGLLDTDNSLNSRYMADQRRKAARLAPAQLAPGPGMGAGPGEASAAVYPAAQPPPVITNDIEAAADAGIPQELLELTLRDLVMRYNGIYNLERHAKILQSITAANEKDQRTRERGVKLIEKDFVQGTIFSFLKALAAQLLEYPEAAVDDLIAKVQSHGADAKPEIITAIREGLGKIINGAKGEIIQNLNMLRGKYQTAPEAVQPEEAAS